MAQMGSDKRRHWTWSDATWSSTKDYGQPMSEHGLCCVECHACGTAQGENTGALVERERIIKLLQSRTDVLDEVNYLIELIEKTADE